MSQQTIYTTVRYDDAPAAMAWLEAVLGFTVSVVHLGEEEGTVAHAQLRLGDDLIMLSTRTAEQETTGVAWTYLVVAAAEVDARYGTAQAAGAEFTHPITEQDYGSREFTVRDPGGHLWTVGTYQPSVRVAP